MKQKLYNIVILSLCIISVVFAIIDFTKGLKPIQSQIDNIIYVLFVIDYIFRFIISDEKRTFFKENIFDLIAIIPLNSAFKAFRIIKFTRLLKLTKLLKICSLSARMFAKSKEFLNTNGFKYVLILSVISILIGTIGIMYFEKMTFTNALWWAFVTATTVGYGDLSPTTNAGRILASLLMLIGIGLIGSLTSSITSFFLRTDKKHQKYSSDKVEMVLAMYKTLSDEEKNIIKQELQNN